MQNNISKIDNIIFAFLLFCSLILAVNGKSWSKYLFDEYILEFYPAYFKIGVYSVLTAAALLFFLIRIYIHSISYRAILGALVGFVASFLILVQSDIPSPLIFSLHIGIFSVSTGILTIEPYLKKQMESEFWKLILESCVKFFQFSLVGIALIVSILAIFHKDTIDGFNSTLFYPILIFMVQGFSIAYWILLPCWKNLINSYEKT